MSAVSERTSTLARYRVHVGFVTIHLVFAVVFVTLLLSAFHQPTPHDLPVGIVAPAQSARQIEAALDAHHPGAFDLHRYPSEAQARHGIEDRSVDGALLVTPGGLRLLTAEAGGTGPAQALTAALDALATKTGHSVTVTDVVPPADGDSEAFSVFFIILGVLFPSIATGSISALVLRRAPAAWRVGVLAAVAVVIGLAVAAIADGFTGLGHYPAIAGIVALFSLAISAPTAVLARIRPPAAALAVLVFVVFGIPVSGGPGGLAPFGPGFLRALDNALPLGVAVTALRNTVYFAGNDIATHLVVLAVWAAAGSGALVIARPQRPPRTVNSQGAITMSTTTTPARPATGGRLLPYPTLAATAGVIAGILVLIESFFYFDHQTTAADTAGIVIGGLLILAPVLAIIASHQQFAKLALTPSDPARAADAPATAATLDHAVVADEVHKQIAAAFAELSHPAANTDPPAVWSADTPRHEKL